ncbi:uncharacterized protein L203_103140 [Cryptococcus depauperatus CBS 7841]|uniref:2-dehydropantoate 2-reductase n=1 Tax=Cryptococcus depauperatus CBS 7841 TaxID=1295531 RepID=A0A1E3IRD7_9TREE|nr:hypothetical protein L203_01585 [Cryptococcus depauperatus CBS 7841]
MRRIHILGLGSVGTLLAHYIRQASPRLAISLIVRKPESFSGSLTVTRCGVASSSTGYNFERPIPSGVDIDILLVTTKAAQTLPAIRAIFPRLGPNSVIALLQNGMGVAEELTTLWPKQRAMPWIVLGITTHGVAPVSGVSRGAVIHHTPFGQGDVKWGLLPQQQGIETEKRIFQLCEDSVIRSVDESSPGIHALSQFDNLIPALQILLSVSLLNPVLLPYEKLREAMLMKLAANAVINPLTAILGRGQLPNGSLCKDENGEELLNVTIQETSKVLVAYLQSQDVTDETLEAFRYPQLRKHITNVLQVTSQNTSSMALDIREQRMTEVEYINGHVIKLGQKAKVTTPVNEMLYNMIRLIEHTRQ